VTQAAGPIGIRVLSAYCATGRPAVSLYRVQPICNPAARESALDLAKAAPATTD
jgi:hypothetical protein